MSEPQRPMWVVLGVLLGGGLSAARMPSVPGESPCTPDPMLEALAGQLQSQALARVEAATAAGVRIRPAPVWPTIEDSQARSQRLSAVLVASAGSPNVRAVRCPEYPCVAVVSFSGPDAEIRLGQFQGWFDVAFSQSPRVEGRNRGGLSLAIALGEPALSAEDLPRVLFRLEEGLAP